MSINIGPPAIDELRPRITVVGVGGAGGNAITNMIEAKMEVTSVVLEFHQKLSHTFIKGPRQHFRGPRPGQHGRPQTLLRSVSILGQQHLCFQKQRERTIHWRRTTTARKEYPIMQQMGSQCVTKDVETWLAA